MEWYDDERLWVDFSSVMFPPERASEATELVRHSPLLAFPPGSRVLDLCCGPGVFVVPLAQAGHRVTGVDLSAKMLRGAEKACAEAGVEAELVEQDMAEHLRPAHYDAVLNMYTSFGYFAEAERNVQVLRNVRDSLVPGGRVLIDLMGKETLARWVGRPKAVDVPGGTVFMRDTIGEDWTRLRTDWTLVSGGTARHASITSTLYSAAELRALLEVAGFVDIRCFGDFDASPYDNHARRLIAQAVKPG